MEYFVSFMWNFEETGAHGTGSTRVTLDSPIDSMDVIRYIEEFLRAKYSGKGDIPEGARVLVVNWKRFEDPRRKLPLIPVYYIIIAAAVAVWVGFVAGWMSPSQEIPRTSKDAPTSVEAR